MLRKNIRKEGAKLLAMSLLAVSSAAQSALVPFSDDFQGPDLSPYAVFSDNGGFPGGYFFAPPSTTGPQISALADDGLGNQYLNFYANYDNVNVHNRELCDPCSPNLQEIISLFKEFTFSAADTAGGDTWVFDFEYASNPGADPLGPNVQTSAFIRVFDPVFNLLDEQVFDTSADTGGIFLSGQLQTILDPNWVDGKIQIGFNNLVGGYESSGRFYDNVNFDVAPVPVPAAVWLFGSGLLGLVGVARRKKADV